MTSPSEVKEESSSEAMPLPDAQKVEDGVNLPQLKRQKLSIPEGMSKNQWKKLQKQKQREETKDEYRAKRREKRKVLNQRKKEKLKDAVSTDKKPKLPESQKPTEINIIMDCEFDDLMNNREIVSLSNQIARCYSAMRHSDYKIGLVINSLNKSLKHRFEQDLAQYKNWTDIQFNFNDTLKDILPKDPEELSKYVYFTADCEEVVTELKPGYTYIIGGIVDKNRHKNICAKKAKELGLQVGKLPISEYIQLNSRHVLATSHVFELCCKWFENGKDWRKAFNEVLPPRKVKKSLEKSEILNPTEESPGPTEECS